MAQSRSRGIRQELSKDKRLYFTFGVHPKRAYKYTPEEMKAIKTALVKDPRCVGIGEMRYDLTQGCSTFVDKQTKVFKEQLQYYLKKQLWQTVLVIHCRDLPNSTKVSDYCLDAMESVLPYAKRGSYRIHRHCYNGGIKEKMPGCSTIQTQSSDSPAYCSGVIVIRNWTRFHIFFHPYSVNIGTIHHMALMKWLGELPS